MTPSLANPPANQAEFSIVNRPQGPATVAAPLLVSFASPPPQRLTGLLVATFELRKKKSKSRGEKGNVGKRHSYRMLEA